MAYTARLLETVKEPVSIEGHQLAITLSIGLAVYPEDGREVEDLQRQADAAMYYAKSLGKNRAQAFADNAVALDGVRMEQELRHALREGWFAVHYQPKFTADYRLAGLEALIRLNHPRDGQILPGQFIAVAEETGLIVSVGAWVIDEVCRQLAEWRRRGLAAVVVAVNVSAIQIARPDFAKSVERCLASHEVPANCLELEVTESLMVNAENEEHRQIQLLRAMGVSISIDDFGTGFSSLSYLHRLKIDAIKLDRACVQTIDSDHGARHLVRAVVHVAKGLGLEVIAEGVETEAQRAELVAVGCPVMQGYLFAYPGPPETIEALLLATVVQQEPLDGDLERLYHSIEESTGEPLAL
jgi:EAL domain-containing protein (putative c-di-GMP-specific phosphodiesterase class I)